MVEAARLMGPPFQSPVTPRSRNSAGLLHVELRPADDSGSIGVLAPRRLRFFLNGVVETADEGLATTKRILTLF